VTRVLPWIALVAVALAAWTPYLVPQAICGASAMADWIRGEAIHAAVEHGDLLPAWLPDLYLRRGSPLPSFYSPFSYLVAELIRQVTAAPGATWKLAHVLFWIVGMTGAGVLGRVAWGWGGGVAAAAAFALSPYLLVDAYANTGLAEFAAMCLVPWALAAVLAEGRGWAVVGAVVVALLPLTHNLTALQAVPVVLVVAALEGGEARRRGFRMIGCGLLLSAFFWLPVLVEKRLLWSDESLTTGYFTFENHFVKPLDLLPGRAVVQLAIAPDASMPLRVGELFWGALLALPLLGLGRRPARERRRAWTFAGLALAALLLSTSLAAPIWRHLPLIAFFQFPFRLLLVATVLMAPLVGLVVASQRSRLRPWLGAGVAALALVLARPQLSPRYLFIDPAREILHSVPRDGIDRAEAAGWLPPDRFVTLERMRRSTWNATASNEFLPRTVTRIPMNIPSEAASRLSGDLDVLASAWGYPEVRAEVRVRATGELLLEQFAFPGWRVEVDGVERSTRIEPDHGRMVVPLEPGDRSVVARYGWTALRRSAAAASALFAVLATWIFLFRAPRSLEASD